MGEATSWRVPQVYQAGVSVEVPPQLLGTRGVREGLQMLDGSISSHSINPVGHIPPMAVSRLDLALMTEAHHLLQGVHRQHHGELIYIPRQAVGGNRS